MPPEAASPAPAVADAPKFESTDDIVGDLLAGDHPEPAKDTEADETQGDDDHADESSTEEDDAAADDPAGDDADPVDGDLPSVLADARAALEAGDIDKAFELAFGKKPEDVQPDNKSWTKWRAANSKERSAIAKERADLGSERAQAQHWVTDQRNQINGLIEQLKPYEAHRVAAVAFQRDGDPAHLVKLIELASGMTYDEAQKAILTKTRRSPAERALQQKLAELEQKFQETSHQRAQQEQQHTSQQVYANDLHVIRAQVVSVPEIDKVPRFAERIYNVLVKTKGPTGLSMTPAEAARRVLAAERRKLEKHPLLAKKNPVSQAAATLAKAKKKPTAPGAPLRRDSQNNGAKDQKAIESTDEIVADLLRGKTSRRLG